MLRFEYFVRYDRDSPEDGDDPLTDDEMIVVLGRFRDDIRRDVLAADPKATADALMSKTNRAGTRMIEVKTTLDAPTVDEAVQRCALRHQLQATLLRCS